MRERRPAQRGNVAPRYRAVSGDDRAERTAHNAQLGAAARDDAARFFRDLRLGLRLARVAVAAQVGTQPSVIAALETGDLARLPPWPKTVRIVSDYARLAGMDPRPVLHALHAAIVHHKRAEAEDRSWSGRLNAWWRVPLRTNGDETIGKARVLTWLAAVALPAALAGSLVLATGPQASSMRGWGADEGAASRVKRDGVTWIRTTDPRARRGDKLQAPQR